MKMRAVEQRQAPCWMSGIGSMVPGYANRRIDGWEFPRKTK
jgi:hypothetical protein